MLNKIWAGFQFPDADFRIFLSKLSLHRLRPQLTGLCFILENKTDVVKKRTTERKLFRRATALDELDCADVLPSRFLVFACGTSQYRSTIRRMSRVCSLSTALF
jgi:hypothetical protein